LRAVAVRITSFTIIVEASKIALEAFTSILEAFETLVGASKTVVRAFGTIVEAFGTVAAACNTFVGACGTVVEAPARSRRPPIMNRGPYPPPMPALTFLLAQADTTTDATSSAPTASAWSLFVQSIDLFTIILVAGSIAAVALLVQCLLEIRRVNLLPEEELERLNALTAAGPRSELASYLRSRTSFPALVLKSMLGAEDAAGAGVAGGAGGGGGVGGVSGEAVREAAQLEADAQCARWLRRIEPLATIGNLAPLVGLAGTVWGMILAFTTIGAEGGAAGPAQLSLGISKALFHTLLGLCLAVPALVAYSVLRTRVDRLCDEATGRTTPLVERVARRIGEPRSEQPRDPQA
jgi:biopolymer transport protein ExbB